MRLLAIPRLPVALLGFRLLYFSCSLFTAIFLLRMTFKPTFSFFLATDAFERDNIECLSLLTDVPLYFAYFYNCVYSKRSIKISYASIHKFDSTFSSVIDPAKLNHRQAHLLCNPTPNR